MSKHRPRRASWLLMCCGLAIAAGTVCIALIGDVRQDEDDVARRVWAYVAVFGVQFVAYVGALAALRRLVRGKAAPGRRLLTAGLGVAVAARLTLAIFSWPNLSDDACRYVWEGLAQQPPYRINPYVTAPDDAPEALRLTPEGCAVTHGRVSAIYPPFTEHMFRLIHPLARTPRGYRAVFLVFDLGTIAVVLLLVKAMGLSPLWVLAYAWHPLVVTEFSGGAHFDAMGIFWMVLALYLLKTRRGLLAYVALGLSISAKYFAAPLALVFWPRTKRWHALAAVVVFVALFASYIPGGLVGLVRDDIAILRGEPSGFRSGAVFDGLRFFLQRYHSNAGIHRFIHFFTREAMWRDPVTRVVTLGLFLAIAFGMVLGRARLLTAGLYVTGALIVLNRIIHPWYVTWIIPWLVLRMAQGRPDDRWSNAAWLWFTATVVTSYTVVIGYVRTMHDANPYWLVPAWSMWLQFAPLVLILIVDAVRRSQVSRDLLWAWRGTNDSGGRAK